MERRFTSREVISLTGITPRQLQWWDERGIVVPARDGRNRLYSLEDLAEVAVLCQLRKKGFPLQKVRKIMRYLQRELGQRLVQTVTEGSDYHLLTDGKRIYLENSAHEVVDVLKNSSQPLLAVCLSDAVREVHAEIRLQTRSQQRTLRAVDAAAATGNSRRQRRTGASARSERQHAARRRA